VLEAHQILTDVYRIDVRPLLAQVRTEMGLSIDPLEAYRNSGNEEKIREERGVARTSGSFQYAN
jgi:L-rhamnose isomerase/sugar isomerase